MFGMGHWEILIIFLVILLIFGAKRIPEMAQGLGKGIKEFRKAMRDVQEEIDISNTNTANPSSGNTLKTAPPSQSVAQDSASAPAAGQEAEKTATSSSKSA